MYKWNVLPICLVFLACCQSNKSMSNVDPAKPVQLQLQNNTKPKSISAQQRKQLRACLYVFYQGTRTQWQSARKKIMDMGPVGVEALSIFMIKFFAGGKKHIPVKIRTQDIAQYWKLARKELVLLKGKAVPYIIYAMAHPKMGTSGRMQCSLTLAQIGRPAVKLLVNSLKQGTDAFQRTVLETLANIGDDSAARAIVDFFCSLKIPSRKVGDDDDLAVVDPTFGLRYYSIKALGKLRTTDSLIAISQALKDPNLIVARQAIKAVANYRIPQALPILKKALALSKKILWSHKHKLQKAIIACSP